MGCQKWVVRITVVEGSYRAEWSKIRACSETFMCTCSIMFPRPCLRLVTRLRFRFVSPRILCMQYNTHHMFSVYYNTAIERALWCETKCYYGIRLFANRFWVARDTSQNWCWYIKLYYRFLNIISHCQFLPEIWKEVLTDF